MDDSTKTQPVESRAAKMLREVFRSGRPLTYIRSAEEQRIGRVLREVGRALHASTPVPVWTWSLTEGLLRDDGVAETGTLDPREALDLAARHQSDALYGDALFEANVILGKMALRRGDKKAAARDLLAAAGTPGSDRIQI